MKIWLLIDDQEFGPFSRAEIFAKLANKEVNLQSVARLDSELEWKPLDDVLKSGAPKLFSPQEIERVQAERPPAQVVIPDFSSVRSTPTQPQERREGRALILVTILLFLVVGWLVFQNLSQVPEVITSKQTAVSMETPVPAVVPIACVPAPEPQKAVVIQESTPSKETPSPTPASVAAATASPAEAPSQEATPAISPSPPSISANSTPSPSPESTPEQFQATTGTVAMTSFFKIESLKVLKKAPKDGMGVWLAPILTDKKPAWAFSPCLEVTVSAKENTRSDHLIAKAYFFDEKGKLLVSEEKPSPSGKVGEQVVMPVLFYKEKPDRFFFEIPKQLTKAQWKVVVVFGDKDEARSACYPFTEKDTFLEYPEKKLVYDRTIKNVVRRPAMDPLIEHVVNTRGSKKMPPITLLLRPPLGVSDPSEVKGVLAICYLGNLETMKADLKREEMSGDYFGLLGFANKHKLAILVWGAWGHWDRNLNYDKLTKDQARELDNSFEAVAKAWEMGVHDLCEQYGMPDHDFLLWGLCGSAQSAHRLCLRKPNYFLAIDIHIPGSFDKPTPEARKVLWCLTTGELYSGYERAKAFYSQCKQLGYPIIFKAIEGLGHASHRDASDMCFEFFDFALAQKDLRDQYDKKMDSNTFQLSSSGAREPWLEIFRHPPYYGDMVNQEVYPATQVDMIPPGFRIPLPTEKIKDIWARHPSMISQNHE